MDANLLRRVNWLWKHRHTHDTDTTQQQINIITSLVDGIADSPPTSGAHLHAILDSTQEIAASGEAVEWSAHGQIARVEFAALDLPTTDIVIPRLGYYDIHLYLAWDSWTAGGSVWVTRERAGDEAIVWPEAVLTAQETGTSGSEFYGTIPAIPCSPQDIIRIYVDHNDASAQDLAEASVAIELVDRYASTPTQGDLIDEALTIRNDTTSQDLTVTMTTAQQPGDIMFMQLVAGSNQFTGYPSGWTALVDNELFGSSAGYWALLWKESDGTETDVTVSVTTSNDEMGAAVWVIRSDRDYSSVSPSISSVNKSTSTTIDPQSVSPATTGNCMVFAIVARNGGPKTPTSGPSGYTISDVLQNPNQGSLSTDIGLEVWRRTVFISSSENPGTITYPTWTAQRLGSVTLSVPI